MEKRNDTMKTLAKRASKKKQRIIIAVVVLALIVLAFAVRNAGAAAAQKTMTAVIQTDEVSIRSLVKSVGATGTIVSVESKEVSVSLGNIEVENILIEVGDMVTEGDELLTFDTSDIQESLEMAQTSLNNSKKRNRISVDEAARNVTDAERMESYQVDKAKESTERAYTEYKSTQNNYNSANSKLEELKTTETSTYNTYLTTGLAMQEAKNAYESAAAISGGDAVTISMLEGTYNAALTVYENATASYQTAKTARETQQSIVEKDAKIYNDAAMAYNNTVKEYNNTVETQASTVSSAKNSQKNTGLSISTDTEEKQVEQYEEQLEEGTLKAPLSGIVTAINNQKGDTYNGGTVLVIQDCSSYEIEAQIGEYDISDIEIGQKVRIKTNATGDEELQGRVTFISPTATKTGGIISGDPTYLVRIAIETENTRLKLDMSASLSIIIESHEDVFTVPYNAIEEEEDGTFYITEVAEDGVTTTKIPVTVVMESNYYTEIQAKDIYQGQKVMIREAEEETGDFLMQMRGF